jgi:hypothetical protein
MKNPSILVGLIFIMEGMFRIMSLQGAIATRQSKRLVNER